MIKYKTPIPSKVAVVFTDMGFFHASDPVKALDVGKDFLTHFDELNFMIRSDAFFVSKEDDSKDEYSVIQRISELIHAELAHYDAFVVVGDPDSVLHPAIMTAFAFENLTKPVIFGGLFDFDKKKSWIEGLKKLDTTPKGLDVRGAFVYTMQFSKIAHPEVVVSYANRSVRAVKARRTPRDDKRFFDSMDRDVITIYDLDVNLATRVRANKKLPTILDYRFDNRVKWLTLSQAENSEELQNRLGKDTKICVFDITQVGFLPVSWARALGNFQDVLFVLYSEHQDTKELCDADNVIASPNFTKETLFVKLTWILAHTTDFGEIQKILYTNCRNEL